MKPSPFQFVFPAVFSAAFLLLASCASQPKDDGNTAATFRDGVPGGTWVDSYKIPVTVTAVDPAKRQVTLVASDNSTNTFTAGSDFKGFDQLRVGEQFQAAVAKETVVFLRKDGVPPAADLSVAKEMVKEGNYSAILRSDTVEKTARVTALNPSQGEATLKFADGTTQNIKVRTDVNLWTMQVGGEVLIRARSVAMLSLGKP
jgi:hypothetical protein